MYSEKKAIAEQNRIAYYKALCDCAIKIFSFICIQQAFFRQILSFRDFIFKNGEEFMMYVWKTMYVFLVHKFILYQLELKITRQVQISNRFPKLAELFIKISPLNKLMVDVCVKDFLPGGEAYAEAKIVLEPVYVNNFEKA